MDGCGWLNTEGQSCSGILAPSFPPSRGRLTQVTEGARHPTLPGVVPTGGGVPLQHTLPSAGRLQSRRDGGNALVGGTAPIHCRDPVIAMSVDMVGLLGRERASEERVGVEHAEHTTVMGTNELVAAVGLEGCCSPALVLVTGVALQQLVEALVDLVVFPESDGVESLLQ